MKRGDKHAVSRQAVVLPRQKSNHILWMLVGGAGGAILGFAAALIFCYFTWVRDLQVHLAAKERALSEWEELNRQERATIASMKSMSVDEMKRWMAANNEQTTFFMDMQRRLHQVETALTGPGTTYIAMGVLGLLGVVGLVVFWLRSADRDAATTLENVATLAPEAMVRAVLVRSLAFRKEPLTIALRDDTGGQHPRELSAPSDE